MPMLDWHGVLSGQPLQWIISGFLTTVWVSVAGIPSRHPAGGEAAHEKRRIYSHGNTSR